MNRWSVLMRKELLEASRSYKILWLPIVFVLLGIMQPLVLYYLPEILQYAGGLPEGMSMSLPEMSGSEVFASTLSDQFDQLGLMILTIGMMSLIVSDKNSGMLTFILTRSATLMEYIISKWFVQAAIVFLSVGSGLLAAWFYTNYLFSNVPFIRVLLSIFVYSVWSLFVLTLTFLLSAMLSRPAAVAALAVFVLIFLKFTTVFKGIWHTINPAALSDHAVFYISYGTWPSEFAATLIITCSLILVFIWLTYNYLSRTELPSM